MQRNPITAAESPSPTQEIVETPEPASEGGLRRVYGERPFQTLWATDPDGSGLFSGSLVPAPPCPVRLLVDTRRTGTSYQTRSAAIPSECPLQTQRARGTGPSFIVISPLSFRFRRHERHMEIAIAGSTGLVGSALVRALKAGGHKVRRLVRSDNELGADNILWNSRQGIRDLYRLEGIDAFVNLSGESIAGGRWTPSRMRDIQRSRVDATRMLVDRVGRLQKKPSVFINASAIGYYGDRGDEVLNEKSGPGDGFLPEVVQAWESEASRARAKGMRLVCTRFGIILSGNGGALVKMLPPFRMGIGGKLGSGRQWMSWVSLTDAINAILHAIEKTELEGPVNVVAPTPVSNAEFTRVLAGVLWRPALFPVPAAALKLMMGQMAEELLLASQRVLPGELERTGFQFTHQGLEGALRAALL